MDDKTRKLISIRTKEGMKRPGVMEKLKKSQKKYFSKPENRLKTSKATKEAMSRPEVRKKIEKSFFIKGQKAWNKNMKCPWTSERNRLNPISGEDHWNWKGGIADSPYGEDWTNTLKESIRQRDNYICQECGVHQEELDKDLDVHHIDYDKLNCNPDNLIALCRPCHIRTNNNREYWFNHFTKT